MEIDKDYAKLLRTIASNIQRVRTSRNLTQEEMAEKGGFNYRYYQKLESGSYAPNLYTLARLARAFKVKVIDFLR